MPESSVLERTAVVQRGRRLEYFTIAWNAGEGLTAIAAGVIAGSISLVGFGIDNFIEVTSGSVLLWRMSVDADVHRRAFNEKRASFCRRLFSVAGRLHCVRICDGPLREASARAQRTRNYRGVRIANRDAAPIESETKGGAHARECGYARRC
jgi:hypothetical protein